MNRTRRSRSYRNPKGIELGVNQVRVAIVTESFLPTINGVTNSVMKVSDHLVSRGHEVIIIAPDVTGAPHRHQDVTVHRVPSLPYRQFPVALPSPVVPGILESFHPDVVHAASPFLLGAQALATAKKLGVGSVAVFQTDIPGYCERNNLSGAEGLAWWTVERIHRSADITLAPSRASVSALSSQGIANVGLWGRGVDLDAFHPSRRLAPATLAFRHAFARPGEVVVGYVGRLAPEKSVERLSALRGLTGIHVLVVGDGPSRQSISNAFDGIPHTLTGALSGSALSTAYAAMDVFVHTGDHETFGQTLQEAHAAGLPVVAPAAGGPLDLITHNVDGFLFHPGHIDDLRMAVSALVQDAGIRARMGEAGRRKVLGRTWESVGDELIGHYERVKSKRLERV